MELAYREYGSGAPLIILHGLFGSRDNWHTLSRRLGQRYHVFAVDQRNHGDSPHDAAFDYQVMANDLRLFVEMRALHDIRLIGHSMGGKTAMQFALTHPAYVERLVVVDIAPKAYDAHHDELFDVMQSLDLGTMQTRYELEDALRPRIPDAPTRQLLLKNVARDDSGAFVWKINLEAIERNYAAVIGAIDASEPFHKPTLFVRGARSGYITDDDEPTIRALFPSAQVVTIPDAGHWVHAEAPLAFLKTVEDFLAS